VDHGRRRDAGAGRGGRDRRFNPCCSGSRSSTIYDPAVTLPADQVSILVVVDHGRRPRTERAVLCTHVYSFNPCCSGSRSSTRPILGRSAHAAVRVSILVVVDHGRRLGKRCPARLITWRVSILVVVDHGRRRGEPDLVLCF